MVRIFESIIIFMNKRKKSPLFLSTFLCLFIVQIEKNAEEFLKKLEKKDAELILNKIYSIKENPFRYLKRLQGEKLWRLRIADYKAIVDVIISMNKIIILRVGHRKNVYD